MSERPRARLDASNFRPSDGHPALDMVTKQVEPLTFANASVRLASATEVFVKGGPKAASSPAVVSLLAECELHPLPVSLLSKAILELSRGSQ